MAVIVGASLALVLLLSLPSAGAEARYWKAQRQGWYWYQIADPVQPQASAASEPAEVAAHRALQERLASLRSVAIMTPTPTNVRAYLEIQKEVLDRSALFADIWQRVVWANPELDYALHNRPTNALAIGIHDDQVRQSQNQLLSTVAQDHGLFFLFGPDCRHCAQTAEVVKRFSARHGMTVQAVAIGSAKLAAFPEAWPDNGFAAAAGATVLPAIYLARLNSAAPELRPIAFGPLSDEEIDRRVTVLTSLQPGARF